MPYEITQEYPTIQKTDHALYIAGTNYVLRNTQVLTLLGGIRVGEYRSNPVTGQLYITMTDVMPGKMIADLQDLKVFTSKMNGRELEKKSIGKVYAFNPDRMDLRAEYMWKKRTGQPVRDGQKQQYGNTGANKAKNGFIPEGI